MTSDDFGGVRFSILLSFYTKAHQKAIFPWHGETILPEFIDLGKSKHLIVGVGLVQANLVFR